MPNLIPQSINEWMRRTEFKLNDLTRRMSDAIPGNIADGVNLNGFMSSGRWRRASAVGTTTALGYPFNGAAGTLEVYWEPTNAQVQQVFYDRSGSRHQRWFNGSTWSAWDGVWVPITNWTTGVTPQTGANAPMAMRQGRIVALRGRANVTLVGTVTFGTLPTGLGLEPLAIVELGQGQTNASYSSRYFVGTGGNLSGQNWPAPPSGGSTTLALSGVYGVGT